MEMELELNLEKLLIDIETVKGCHFRYEICVTV